jgi:AcrR family transcriptional regulator
MKQRRLTKRGSARREQIVQTALRLFSEQGYHGTTVGDVCEALGVGKGVIYWYFRSKEALFIELLQSTLLELRRAQEVRIQEATDPRSRIEEGIRASIEFFRQNPGYLGLIRTAARYDEFAGFVEKGQEIVVADTATHIKEGIALGQIREGDPELMAHGVLGATFHFVEVYFGTEGNERAVNERPQLADEAVAFCLQGLQSVDAAVRREA